MYEEKLTLQDIIRICNTTSVYDRTRDIRRFFPELGLKGCSDLARKDNKDLITALKPFCETFKTCPTCNGLGKVKI